MYGVLVKNFVVVTGYGVVELHFVMMQLAGATFAKSVVGLLLHTASTAVLISRRTILTTGAVYCFFAIFLASYIRLIILQ